MAKRMGGRKPFSSKNIEKIPSQSGVYNLINRGGEVTYTGSAGAGRLPERLKEHLRDRDIPGVTQFQVRPTSSTEKARSIEEQLIARNKPRHNIKGK